MVFRRKFIALNVYIIKNKIKTKSKINNLQFYFRKLERDDKI